MLRRSVFVGGMLVLLIASLAAAQQRGGFGGRRFGGFGGSQGSSSVLLGMQEVQKELQISAEQKRRLDKLLGALRDETRSIFGGTNFQDLGRDERQERFAEVREKTEKATKKADQQIANILNDEQALRLGQLRVQREGSDALNRPEVAKQLGLNEDQTAKIRTIQEESRSQGRGGFGGPGPGGGDRGDFMARMRERREKMEADIVATLTDAQKETWSKMKGKEFEFPRPQGRGGRGGFGGRGGNTAERRRPPTKPRDQ